MRLQPLRSGARSAHTASTLTPLDSCRVYPAVLSVECSRVTSPSSQLEPVANCESLSLSSLRSHSSAPPCVRLSRSLNASTDGLGAWHSFLAVAFFFSSQIVHLHVDPRRRGHLRLHLVPHPFVPQYHDPHPVTIPRVDTHCLNNSCS